MLQIFFNFSFPILHFILVDLDLKSFFHISFISLLFTLPPILILPHPPSYIHPVCSSVSLFYFMYIVYTVQIWFYLLHRHFPLSTYLFLVFEVTCFFAQTPHPPILLLIIYIFHLTFNLINSGK